MLFLSHSSRLSPLRRDGVTALIRVGTALLVADISSLSRFVAYGVRGPSIWIYYEMVGVLSDSRSHILLIITRNCPTSGRFSRRSPGVCSCAPAIGDCPGFDRRQTAAASSN